MFHILPFLFVSLLVGYAKSADDCDSPTAMSPFDFDTIMGDWHIIAFAGENTEKAYPQKIQSFDCPTATFGRDSMSKIQYRMEIEWIPGPPIEWTGQMGSPNPIDLATYYDGVEFRTGKYTVMEIGTEMETEYILAYFCTSIPYRDYKIGYYMILTKTIPSDAAWTALIDTLPGSVILNFCLPSPDLI